MAPQLAVPEPATVSPKDGFVQLDVVYTTYADAVELAVQRPVVQLTRTLGILVAWPLPATSAQPI